MATGRIGVTPTLGTRWSKAPAGGTTSLSGLDDNSVALVYSVGYEQVYRNGVLLSRGNDYTATTGNSITLTDATIAGDIIEVFANELVPLTDAISKGQFTAKGALLSATAASTPGVLTVGSNDQVLTADSSTSTGLKWATPAAGSLTLLSTTTLTGATVTISSISQSYTDLYITMENPVAATNQVEMYFRVNADGTANRYAELQGFGASNSNNTNQSRVQFAYGLGNTDRNYFGYILIPNYTNTTMWKSGFVFVAGNNAYNAGYTSNTIQYWAYNQTTAVSSMSFFLSTGNFSSGSIKVYGVK